MTGVETVVIVGVITIRPERDTDCRHVLAALAEATNSEPGCLDFRYGTVTGGGLPAHLIAERYDGRAAFEAHGEQEHTRAYAAALPGLLADSATFNISTAGRHETLTVQAAGLFAGGRLPIVGYSA